MKIGQQPFRCTYLLHYIHHIDSEQLNFALEVCCSRIAIHHKRRPLTEIHTLLNFPLYYPFRYLPLLLYLTNCLSACLYFQSNYHFEMCSTIPFYVIGNLSLFISDILREPLGWMFLFAHTHRQKLKAFWNHNFSPDRYQYSRFPDRISIPVTYTKCPSIPYWPLTSVSRARWSITWLSNNNNSNSHSCSNIRLPHTSLPACWKVSNWNAGYSIITYFGRVGESWIKLFPCPGYNVWLGVFVDIRIDP